MFVDTLPSPYYDMLIVNTFMEFGDLMYSVRRIEDGIKRGRIVDTKTSMREKKRIVPDEYVQAMSREEKSWTLGQPRKGTSPINMLKNQVEENSSQWKNLSGTSFTHVLHVPRYPQSDIFRPKSSHENMIKGLT